MTAVELPLSLPPSYSSSEASPQYTPLPRAEELSLTRTVRASHARNRAVHTIVCEHESKAHGFSVSFLHQLESATASSIPSYSQGDVIDGFVQVHNRTAANISSVAIKLDGHLDLSATTRGNQRVCFLKTGFEIWHLDSAVPDQIPEQIDFSLPLPTTISDDDTERPLPSSFDTDFIAGLRASVQYTLKITVYTKGALGGVFKRSHSLTTPISFIHRSRPPLAPLSRDESFLSTVKVAPEEWSVIEMDLPVHRLAERLRLTLALPASRVYCVSGRIPVHVQLTGPATALQQFLAPASAVDDQENDTTEALHGRARSHSPTQPGILFDTVLAPIEDVSRRVGKVNQHRRTMSTSITTGRPLACQRSKPRPDVTCHIDISLQRRIAAGLLGDQIWRTQRLSPSAELELVNDDVDSGWLSWNGTIIPSVPESWAPAARFGELLVADLLVVDVRTPVASSRGRSQMTVRPHSQLFPVILATDPFPLSHQEVISAYDEIQDLPPRFESIALTSR